MIQELLLRTPCRTAKRSHFRATMEDLQRMFTQLVAGQEKANKKEKRVEPHKRVAIHHRPQTNASEAIRENLVANTEKMEEVRRIHKAYLFLTFY